MKTTVKCSATADSYIKGAIDALSQNAHYKADIELAIQHLRTAKRLMGWAQNDEAAMPNVRSAALFDDDFTPALLRDIKGYKEIMEINARNRGERIKYFHIKLIAYTAPESGEL